MAGRLGPPSGRYAGKSAEERKAERRRRFLDAALELFGGGPGYRSTTVAALSEAAGLSTRQFYEEFRTLEDVLAALHLQVNDWAEAAVLTAAAEAAGAPIAQRAAAIFRAYAADVTRDPRRIRIAFVEIIGVSPRLEEQRLARRARWVDLICAEAEAAVARGEAPPATTASPRPASSAVSTGCCTTGTRGGSRPPSTRWWTNWSASSWRSSVRRRRRGRPADGASTGRGDVAREDDHLVDQSPPEVDDVRPGQPGPVVGGREHPPVPGPLVGHVHPEQRTIVPDPAGCRRMSSTNRSTASMPSLRPSGPQKTTSEVSAWDSSEVT